MKKLLDDSRRRWRDEKMILCMLFVRAFGAAHMMKIVEFLERLLVGYVCALVHD